MNLRKMLFLPNETLYGVLIDDGRKRPSNKNKTFGLLAKFGPNLGQIQQSSALNV